MIMVQIFGTSPHSTLHWSRTHLDRKLSDGDSVAGLRGNRPPFKVSLEAEDVPETTVLDGIL